MGLTSVLLITMPRTEINLPIQLALTSRMGNSFFKLRSLKYISLKRNNDNSMMISLCKC